MSWISSSASLNKVVLLILNTLSRRRPQGREIAIGERGGAAFVDEVFKAEGVFRTSHSARTYKKEKPNTV